MQDFLDTVSYSGSVVNWRDEPDTGASEDEPDDGMPDSPRTAAKKYRSETVIHTVADDHAPTLKSLITSAFMAGKREINRSTLLHAVVQTDSPSVIVKLLEPAIQKTAQILSQRLEGRLLACLVDGGNAALKEL